MTTPIGKFDMDRIPHWGHVTGSAMLWLAMSVALRVNNSSRRSV